MNFLAHFYLSGDYEALSLGNYLGDFATSKDKQKLPDEVIKGIHLHYAIDTFTDAHPVFKLSVSRLRNKFKKYAPVVADIYYDHFLAKNWEFHHAESLQGFAENRYALLDKHAQVLNQRALRFKEYMQERNMLFNYQHLEALEQVFYGMSRRARFESGMEKAVSFLSDNY